MLHAAPSHRQHQKRKLEMDWDTGAVTSVGLNLGADNAESQANSKFNIQKKFREFIRNFRVGTLFIYRDQLLQRFRKSTFLAQNFILHPAFTNLCAHYRRQLR